MSEWSPAEFRAARDAKIALARALLTQGAPNGVDVGYERRRNAFVLTVRRYDDDLVVPETFAGLAVVELERRAGK